MATKEPTKNGSAQKRDVAVDVRANDLLHIGEDTQGYNHYYDAQRDRILVVDGTHDEYTRESSVLVRRRLVADGQAVEHVQEAGDTHDLEKYVRFVDSRVDDRDWRTVEADFLDLESLLAAITGDA